MQALQALINVTLTSLKAAKARNDWETVLILNDTLNSLYTRRNNG